MEFNDLVASKKDALCLNPYCNGRYSWSIRPEYKLAHAYMVLILIVMEDTHGGYKYCRPKHVVKLLS